LEEEVGEV
jgi:hypothetical protein